MNQNISKIKQKNVAKNCVLHKNHNGITLIALVITIIVMLILVSVTISMAVNGGLFGYAGNAAKETEEAKQKELDWLNVEGLSTDQLIVKYTAERNKEVIETNGSDLGAGLFEYNNIIYDISNDEVVIVGAKNDIAIIIGGDNYIALSPTANQTWYQWATDETNNQDLFIDPGYGVTGKYLKDVIKECYEQNEDSGIDTIFAIQYEPGYPVYGVTFYINASVSDKIEKGTVYSVQSYM